MRNIQIENTGFVNKGAELMLRAIVHHFKDKNTRLVFKGSQKNANRAQKASLNLYSPFQLQRFKVDFTSLFPKEKFINEGLVNVKDVDVVLDAGGFRIGDQWIYEATTKGIIDNKLKHYRKLKRRGCKIIFLPQALGLFTKPLAKYYMQELYKLGDLFFARDNKSYMAVKELVDDSSKLVLSPDFTNLYKPQCSIDYSSLSDKICIVPNVKMITHTNGEIAQEYIRFLEKIVCYLSEELNEQVFFLNHEGNNDLELIKKINKNNFDVYNNKNADEIKLIIGSSKMLISSRFHGVVSGLSQATPTFCTAWSHKYQELMKDYQSEDCILDILDIEASKRILKEMLELDNYKQKVSLLKEKGKGECLKTIHMWDRVDRLIFKS
ncbi:polysaccharide pyruvyl transferase family protein [Algibacter mikhailovii]|uniref:Polysaccharide pyruvyl transferase domain-containing protein n=1 Tax=Algibacter mikhailovii TaxID=425498 RepID=A0A918R186_9FLAO|nr:polysaccharide pyruvyl transferase family protein [Algibacter mikhailovii]GGZ81068.1 hypothetical protein GCM10007028_18120 [Algibacter mikhailovii]